MVIRYVCLSEYLSPHSSHPVTSKIITPSTLSHNLQAWRLRMYPTEKILGAAKPLLFLRAKLALGNGQCKRIL